MGIMPPFTNVYDDAMRAASYAQLDFPGTYWLAFRDLPAIIAEHVQGSTALDFGCGAGRSARFLKRLGFDVTGIDVSQSMLELARKADPAGTYIRVDDGDYSPLDGARFDLIQCAFPFDNIPNAVKRADMLRGLRRLLEPTGKIILLGSTAAIYTHEWVSFTTKQFPENRTAKSGEFVRIVMKDVPDDRPVVDAIWFDQDYLDLFTAAGLELVADYRPLGRAGEPFAWQSELTVAPWFIYVLQGAA